jgi:hypothetical protein
MNGFKHPLACDLVAQQAPFPANHEKKELLKTGVARDPS